MSQLKYLKSWLITIVVTLGTIPFTAVQLQLFPKFWGYEAVIVFISGMITGIIVDSMDILGKIEKKVGKKSMISELSRG